CPEIFSINDYERSKNPVWEQLKEEAVKEASKQQKSCLERIEPRNGRPRCIIGERYCPNFLLYFATD
ncbi:MAG: hypothetical protein AAF900_01440, partial [Bacteroidota bacterium]